MQHAACSGVFVDATTQYSISLRIMYRGAKIQASFRKKRSAGKGTHHRRSITSEQFKDDRIFSGLCRSGAADLLGVSLRTVGHWETGKARPAYAALRLLRILRHGELVDPAWSGYHLRRGALITPEGHAILPGDMAWHSLLVRRSAALSDLLAWREGVRLAGPASEASALGLVSFATSRIAKYETAQKQLPNAHCAAANMGPQSGHEQPEAGYQEVQSQDAGAPGARRAGSGRRSWRLPQRLLPVGNPELHRLDGQADPRLCWRRRQRGWRASARRPRYCGTNKSGGLAPRRSQRSVPVRQWEEGQGLSSRVLLTGLVL